MDVQAPPAVVTARRRVPLFAERPELLPLAGAAAAWAILVATAGGEGTHGSHGWHALHIAVMVLATMGLFAVPVVRAVAYATPWWRAGRAAVIAFVAFTATWFGVALGLHGVAETLDTLVGSPTVVAGALAGCAGAALNPRRRARLLRCGSPVRLRSGGAEADLDCARSGVLSALRCARLGAAPMLVMLAVPGGLWVMAALTGVGLAERWWAPRGALAVSIAYVGLALVAA